MNVAVARPQPIARPSKQGPSPEKRPYSHLTDREKRNLDWQPAASLSEKRMADIFGPECSHLKELADRRPSLKVGDLTALRHDPEGLAMVRKMLLERSDLEVGDLTRRGRDGQLVVEPSVRHGASRKLLLGRPDLKPAELTRMHSNFSRWLRDATVAHTAYRKGLKSLSGTPGLRPADLEGQIAKTLHRGQGGPSELFQGLVANFG